MAPFNTVADVLASRSLHVAEPLIGVIFSVILVLASITVISGFLTQRILSTKTWRRLPFVVWLVYLIYVDSYLFVFVTAILQFALGVNTSISICDGAILLCLVCYVTTKASPGPDPTHLFLIYLFLVERAHIVRGTPKHRLKSKLYLFNSFGMLGIYVIIAIFNFIYRITRLEDQLCVIGMQKKSMIPLISFDAVVNVYLTILFLIPLKNLYSFKNFPKTPANINLRTLALRTFIGAVCTLTSSIINLTVLMVLNGEPGWVCLMCCNSDILFSAAVVQWVTSKDHAGSTNTNTDPNRRGTDVSYPHDRAPENHRRHLSVNNNGFGADDVAMDKMDFSPSTKGFPSSRATEFDDDIKEHLEPTLRRTSSQKRVLDDMGDIAIIGRRSDGEDAAYKQRHDAASSSMVGHAQPMHPPPASHIHHHEDGPRTILGSGVMVTTTISRESRPGNTTYEESSLREAGHGELAERRGRRWAPARGSDAAGVFNDDAYLSYATTEITAGKQDGGRHHHPRS
ncbi:hypothetical protein F5X68DRAFT_260856 [Plectosphaerella plurivora]|uniref:Uncharacterized protein n=1 Tax=Plectosphaerella plurivora TaxID=936078 RepID=A0A9P8VE25_9PEZI|nr:hypothetical protein F5X68DRAFT_260856 [Plectosphaerella plurivora]